ncbi:MAG: hypothetical protein EHM20_11225 [Alphaproteobacteria bacterium]|nr:MAG: hypothetical protein EHM20_11225 [Alphaproteobacteria bacterium]
MKHSLLLFSLLFATMACKNINSTSTEMADRKLPFNSKAFLRLENIEIKSNMRQQFLNTTLAKKLKSNFEIKEFEKLTEEELLESSSLNPLDYYRLKENSAEVVISFSDRIEIYFVPTGISNEKVLSQLGIVPDEGSEFFWLEAPDAYLINKKTYYLTSTTIKELKENDVYFNQNVENLGSDFNEKYFSFSNSQIVKLKIKSDYRVKETAHVILAGRNASSYKRCDWEAGECKACKYQIEAATGNYIKRDLETAASLDLDVIINGKNYPLVELKPTRDASGDFVVELDLKKMADSKLVSIEFHKNIQYPITKIVSGFGYTMSCMDKSLSSNIDITPSLKIDLEMSVFGRNITEF